MPCPPRMSGKWLIHKNCLRWCRTTEIGYQMRVCAIYGIQFSTNALCVIRGKQLRNQKCEWRPIITQTIAANKCPHHVIYALHWSQRPDSCSYSYGKPLPSAMITTAFGTTCHHHHTYMPSSLLFIKRQAAACHQDFMSSFWPLHWLLPYSLKATFISC